MTRHMYTRALSGPSALFPAMTMAMALAVFACAGNQGKLRQAKSSAYNAAFATVFEEAGSVVRHFYPQGSDDATTGVIQTAWYPMRILHEEAPPNRGYEPHVGSQFSTPTTQDGKPLQTPTAVEQRNRQQEKNRKAREQVRGKSYYIRFDVKVDGKGPFVVRVIGHASEKEEGMTPRSLTGGETPYWVEERANALEVAIYERLQRYAVPAMGAAPPSAR